MQTSLQKTEPGPSAAVNALPCLVCGGQYGQSQLAGLFECGSCGFISADLSIPSERLEALYGRDYFHGQEYLDYIAEGDSLRLNFRNRIPVLRKLLANWPAAHLFEIGCAYGFFLDEVRGEVSSASGIDVSEDAVRYAVDQLGVNARQCDYLTSDIGARVDVVTMWDTIEHLKRPDLFVAKTAENLKPGGIFAITTGDIGSLNARLRGRRWRMIHPPTHMHYFSVATLSKLLDRNGFDVVHVSHPGNSRHLRSVLHFILALKLNRPRLYELLKSIPVFNVSLTVNLFDIMYVIGRRRPIESGA